MAQRLPLEDVVVVALEQAAAAPLCSRNLADLGARVIKIERPIEGDLARNMDKVLGPWSSIDLWVNPGKESFTLDVKHPRALEILVRLVERADIYVENLRPGMAAELGISYDLLCQHNPRIVYCQISGFGLSGPYAQRKAFDFIIQGEVGLIELTGTPEAPARVGATVADTSAALHATIAILAALHEARTTGLGQQIDVSMLESNAWYLANLPFRYWYKGEVPQRYGLRHPLLCPYGVYEAADGRINFTVVTQAMWVAFCEVIDRADLLDDPRFSTPDDRSAHRADLNAIVEPLIRKRRAAEWMELLDAAGVPCGMVRGIGEVLEHPQFQHRGFISELPSEHGPAKVINFPAKFRGKYHTSRATPPLLGQDTDAILAELGYSETDIADLRQAGVV